MTLQPGQPVPEHLTVLDSRGEEIRLTSLRGDATLLIYLRHLG